MMVPIRRGWVSVLAVLTAGVGLSLAGLFVTPEASAQPGKRAAFMRQKLEYSKNILEGLTREDFDSIAINARKLLTLSEAAEWEVFSIPNMDYVRYSSDFQRLTQELIAESKAKDIDGATLSFTQLTVSCVKCHKFVRSLPVKPSGGTPPDQG